MKKKNIAIIGLGGIGFRHFQSLMNSNLEIKLVLVDVSQNALERARRFEENNKNNMIELFYTDNIEDCPRRIDVAIIATSSLVRREVFESLVFFSVVDAVILEKFLFPREEDYEYVRNLIKEKNIKAYVNCPCRLYPGYINIKKELNGIDRIDAIITGANWGLACNAIHTVDTIGYLLDSYDEMTVDASMLNDKIEESKREGYIEFTGWLICEIGTKGRIIMGSDDTGEVPIKLILLCGEKTFIIYEADKKMFVSCKGSSQLVDFPIYYQSELTASVVGELITTGKCGLTRYEDTIQWHTALLKAFIHKYNQITRENKDCCPIT